jgi:hypothetical protein
MEWIVYYADGSSFTNEDGTPENAPRDGVQCVAIANENFGKVLWHGGTSENFAFYCWHDTEWVPHDMLGLMTYLGQPGATKIVLRGYAIPVAAFRTIYYAAVEDQRLPFKTDQDLREPSAFTL